MCLPIDTPPSYVIEQRLEERREKPQRNSQSCEQDPIEPRDMNCRLIQLSHHFRPEVALQLGVFQRPQRVPEPLPHLFQIFFVHGLTPMRWSFFRNSRTPRNSRSLTAPSEIPRASAIRPLGSSST